ncbi:MAG: hypothetical protein KGK07_04575 [Chloroflexota bacterium]|nr:hypothetical protein [Chloroflexota bacterium]
MYTDRERQLEAAALAHDREQRDEIEALREDAIAESEHGWRNLLFTVVDSLAAGAVLGIGAGILVTELLLLTVMDRLGTGGLLLAGGAPLAGLGLVLAIIAVPLHRSRVGTRRFAANTLLVAWLIGDLALLMMVWAKAIR